LARATGARTKWLLFVTFLCLWANPLPAQDTSPATPDEDGPETAQPAEMSTENREELAQSIADSTESARTLKRLLLGRKWWFFGRVEGDAAGYSGDIFDGENGAEIRRLRTGIAGVLTDHFSYKAELDLADKTASLSDTYLKLDAGRFGALTLGNQRVAQNLSAMTGSVSQLFMEFPLPVSTFSLARRLGVSQDYYTERWGIHGMLFTRDPNNDAGKHGWSFRTFFNPTRKDSGVAHLGFSAVREKIDSATRLRTRPESHITDVRLVDTGEFDDVRYRNIFGLEAAGSTGPFSGRIEVFKSTWERAGERKNEYYGAYLEAGYFLTGQRFRYRQGRFVRPEIGGSRAWEIGARLSWIDLDDVDVQGGEQLNLGLALNYYLRQDLRIQGNLLRIRTKNVPDHVRSWIVQARIQFNW
jgi:phosphate-selective porin OprO/OprP